MLTCRAPDCPARDLFDDAGAEEPPGRAWGRVSGCGDCRGYVEQVRSTMAVLGALPQDLVTPDFRRRVLEGFRGWQAPT